MIVLCFLLAPTRAIPWADGPAPSGSAPPAIDHRIRSAMLGLAVSLAIGFPLAALCTVVLGTTDSRCSSVRRSSRVW